jgi:hypothetical protein
VGAGHGGSLQPIEQVTVGERVLSRDERTRQNVIQPVTRTFGSKAKTTVVVSLSSGECIEATPEHPFYQEGKGFVAVGQLARESRLTTHSATKSVQIESMVASNHMKN